MRSDLGAHTLTIKAHAALIEVDRVIGERHENGLLICDIDPGLENCQRRGPVR